MTSTDLLDGFSQTDRTVVTELMRRIILDPDNNVNVVTFLRGGDKTFLNTKSPNGGAGGNGLEGSDDFVQLVIPLTNRETLSNSSFSFSPEALQSFRDALNPPDSTVRAAIGAKIHSAYLDGEDSHVFISTYEFAGEIGIQQIQLGRQIRALVAVGAVETDRRYFADMDLVALKLTRLGQQWALRGFPETIGGPTVEVSVDVHLDVSTTIEAAKQDQSIDPELRRQWEAMMKDLEKSIEGASGRSPMRAAVDALDTAAKSAGLFTRTVEFIHRHSGDLARIGGSVADNLPGI